MPESHKKFHDEGFCMIKNLLSKREIDAILQQFESLLDEVCEHVTNKPAPSLSLNQKYLHLKTHHPEMKSHVYDLMKYVDRVQAVAFKNQLLDMVKSVIGETVLINNISVRVDDASNDRELPLHQEGLGQISLQGVNVWIPLVDVNEQTGTLKYVPKSHLKGYVPHKFYADKNNYHGIREEYLSDINIQYASLNKGDSLLFHPCLFHGSAMMQHSEGLRWTLVLRFSDIKNVPYLQQEDQPLRTKQIDSFL